MIEKWDSPKQAFVGNREMVLGLMEMTDYDFQQYTMAHLAFSISKVAFAQVVEKAKKENLEIVAGPKPQRDGETILFHDPSGNILEVCYPSLTEWSSSRKQVDP